MACLTSNGLESLMIGWKMMDGPWKKQTGKSDGWTLKMLVHTWLVQVHPTKMRLRFKPMHNSTRYKKLKKLKIVEYFWVKLFQVWSQLDSTRNLGIKTWIFWVFLSRVWLQMFIKTRVFQAFLSLDHSTQKSLKSRVKTRIWVWQQTRLEFFFEFWGLTPNSNSTQLKFSS